MKNGSPDMVSTPPVMEDPGAGDGVRTSLGDWNLVDKNMKEEELVIVDDLDEDEDEDEDEDQEFDVDEDDDEDQEFDEGDGWEAPPRGLSGLFYHTPDGAPMYSTFDSDPHVLLDPELSFLPESVAVKASAGGLLCCRGRESLRYYVCNPHSAEWATIPTPNKDHALEVAVVLVLEEQQDLDSIYGEYHLVCAYQINDLESIYGGGEGWGVYGFESFSSRRWEWEVSAWIIDGKHILPSSGVAADGAAHWRTTIETVVVSYIPAVDVYRETELPAKYTREVPWELGELGGKLCCTSLLMGTTAVVQVLQDEGEYENGHRGRWKEVARLEVGSDETAVVEGWPSPVRSQGGCELLFWEWHGLWQVVAHNVASKTARRRLVYNAPAPGYYAEFVPYMSSHIHLKSFHMEKSGADEGKRVNMNWNKEMDEALLDALLEQQSKGNRLDGTWSSNAYTNVVKQLNEQLKKSFEKKHITRRMKKLKSKFYVYYELFRGMSGFSWNPETELFEAEPEVWFELLQDKPKAIKLKNTKIPHYEKMYELFSKDRATGHGAMMAADQVRQWANEGSFAPVDITSEANEEGFNFLLTSHMVAPTQVITEGTSSSKKNGKQKTWGRQSCRGP